MHFKEMMLLYHHENVLRIREGKSKLLLLPYMVGYCLEDLKQQFKQASCCIRGHQWKETSLVRPDHASTHLECKKCGKIYTHIWY